MKTKTPRIYSLLFALAAQAALGLDSGNAAQSEIGELPFKYAPSHRFEKHQYANSKVTIGVDGAVVVRTTFENGKRLDGDHFYCRIELLDADQNRIAVARQEAGLNAALGGKPKKRTLSSSMTIEADEIPSIKFVRLTYGHFHNANDEKWWAPVKKVVKTAADVIIAKKTGGFVKVAQQYWRKLPAGQVDKLEIRRLPAVLLRGK